MVVLNCTQETIMSSHHKHQATAQHRPATLPTPPLSASAISPRLSAQLREQLEEIRATTGQTINFIQALYTVVSLTEAAGPAHVETSGIINLISPIIERIEQQNNWLNVIAGEIDRILPQPPSTPTAMHDTGPA
jgi:hypothetical protein